MTAALPQELAPFVSDDRAVVRGLLVLSAPESLTDALARDLLHLADGDGIEADAFVEALHLCDFVVERNSEWHLAPRIREALVEQLTAETSLAELVHERLLALATSDDATPEVPDELPRYLRATVGRAYHATFLSADGVRRYAQVANEPLTGQQWLAGYLASEQMRLGVIPEDAIEVTFLQGMILYREGRRREAEPLLLRVAECPEVRHEVAVASHLVGRMKGKRPRTRKEGEALLWKSLEIGSKLGDSLHRPQVLHTLGQLIGRDPRRRQEAEELLRKSLELQRTMKDEVGLAQVLQTLGQLIGRDRKRRQEAEKLLRESLELERKTGNLFGLAQVLHTLAQLIRRDRSRQDETEALLRESLEIGRRLNRRRHQAQVLQTLGQLLGRNPRRRAEAEELLRESLEVEQGMDDPFGRAQVLHTLGQLVGRDRGRRSEAEALLRESLKLGRRLNRVGHQAQVLHTLGRLVGEDPERREEAETLLTESLELDRRRGNVRGQQIVEDSLKRFRGTR